MLGVASAWIVGAARPDGGERSECEEVGVRGTHRALFCPGICGSSPSPQPSPRKERGEGEVVRRFNLNSSRDSAWTQEAGCRWTHDPPDCSATRDLTRSKAIHERQGRHHLRAERRADRPETASCPAHPGGTGARGTSPL